MWGGGLEAWVRVAGGKGARKAEASGGRRPRFIVGKMVTQEDQGRSPLSKMDSQNRLGRDGLRSRCP